MTKLIKKAKQVRVRHNQAYKTEDLALADRIGVAQAAKQLDIYESQLYAWRTKIKADQGITARAGVCDRECETEKTACRSDGGARHSKKGYCVFREKPEVKYAFIEVQKASFGLKGMRRVLETSRSGFYDWKKRQVVT